MNDILVRVSCALARHYQRASRKANKGLCARIRRSAQLAGTWAFDPTRHRLSLIHSRLAGGRDGQDSSVAESPGVAKAAEAKPEPSLMGRKILIPRRIDLSFQAMFLGRTTAGARSLRGRQIRHEEAGLNGDRQIGTSWHVFPASARQSEDVAHTAIMVQDPTERPMNAGDQPSQASWWRAPGDTGMPKTQQNRGALRILAQSQVP